MLGNESACGMVRGVQLLAGASVTGVALSPGGAIAAVVRTATVGAQR